MAAPAFAAQSFGALGDESRLAIVTELAKGERAVSQLVDVVDISQPGVSQHLKVLRDAGLVRMRPQGQRRLHSLDPQGFRVIELWLERHRRVWAKRLDTLEQHMDDNP
jgi:DNA-binding transcriptional ArsR family regulator